MKKRSSLSNNKPSKKPILKGPKKASPKRLSPELREVVEGVGSFMQYWGFSAVDGKIWALLYLSPKPLSSAELGATLGLSKAMMSLSLNELLKYHVIEGAGFVKHGTQVFVSTKDIKAAVENVICNREKKMLARIAQAARKLEAVARSQVSRKLEATTHSQATRELDAAIKSPAEIVLGSVDPLQASRLREMCESAEWMVEVLVLAPGLLAGIGNFQAPKDSDSKL